MVTKQFAQALRLVVPFRHIYGQNVDVQRLLNEPEYAKSVLDLAMRSTSATLRDCAAELRSMLLPQPTIAPRADAAPRQAVEADAGLGGKYQFTLR